MPQPLKNSIAFWIAPGGEIHRVPSCHIEYVIDHPNLFGMSEDRLRTIYEEHNEPWRCEGLAREKIIRQLISQGWIRVRRYSGEYAVNVRAYDTTCKNILSSFVQQLTSEGFDGRYEEDQHMPLAIRVLAKTPDQDPQTQIRIRLNDLLPSEV